MNELSILSTGKNCKLYKTNYNLVNNSISSAGIPFVGCGTDVGIILGSAYRVEKETTKQFSKDVVVSPFILFCENLCQASTMFENIKNDKVRFNKLSAEIQKQKIMDSMTISAPQEQNVQTASQSLSEVVTQAPMERGKRLALNNGIFIPENMATKNIDAA